MRKSHRRFLRPLAGLAALSLMVAACGDDSDSDDESSDTTATTAAPADNLHIGVLFPETGNLAGIISALRTPVDMAVEEINAAGGVLGKPVTLAAADDTSDNKEQARAGFDRLVNSEGVRVLLGPASSTLTEDLMSEIRSSNVVACSGSNTSATLEDLDDGGHYFGFAPNDNLQGPALAEVISGDGHESVAILARNDTYGTGFASATEDALEEAGVDVVLNRAYDFAASTGYRADVQAVVDAAPDAVVVLGFEEGAAILSQMIESGIGPSSTAIYTADGMKSDDLPGLVDAARPDVLVGVKGTAPAAAPGGVEHPFTEAYAATGQPTIFSPYYYDCAIATALAAEAAGSLDADDVAAAVLEVTSGGTPCNTFADCKALLDAGEDIDYNGASGNLDLNERGHVTQGAYDVWAFNAEGADATLEDVPQIVIDLES